MTIENESQYEVTKKQAAKFAAALDNLDTISDSHYSKIMSIQRDAITTVLLELTEDIDKYEKANP